VNDNDDIKKLEEDCVKKVDTLLDKTISLASSHTTNRFTSIQSLLIGFISLLLTIEEYNLLIVALLIIALISIMAAFIGVMESTEQAIHAIITQFSIAIKLITIEFRKGIQRQEYGDDTEAQSLRMQQYDLTKKAPIIELYQRITNRVYKYGIYTGMVDIILIFIMTVVTK